MAVSEAGGPRSGAGQAAAAADVGERRLPPGRGADPVRRGRVAAALDVEAGWRVLDVARGSGNAALAAARLGAEAVGVDYVPALLERGRRRAEAEGLDVVLVEGDAEALPFGDGEFDAATSVFGAMFAPDHGRAAAELVRVVTARREIGLATWTPDGFIGEMLRAVARHVPPPPALPRRSSGAPRPTSSELFGDAIESIRCQERTFVFRFRSAEAWVDSSGPTTARRSRRSRPSGPRRAAAPRRPGRSSSTRMPAPARARSPIPAAWLETVAVRR